MKSGRILKDLSISVIRVFARILAWNQSGVPGKNLLLHICPQERSWLEIYAISRINVDHTELTHARMLSTSDTWYATRRAIWLLVNSERNRGNERKCWNETKCHRNHRNAQNRTNGLKHRSLGIILQHFNVLLENKDFRVSNFWFPNREFGHNARSATSRF
jgi:hypothetical protein